MFSSIAEGYIQKICGRYLKNFSSENISIGVTGTVTITDIQVRTEELSNFQLPYRPASISIGSLYADLPFVSGGNFDIRVSDVLVVVEKNDQDLCDLHPHFLQRALQLWIGAFYFNIANSKEHKATTTAQSISSSEIEYIQKLIDRLCITIDSFHFRLEEVFTAHIPSPIGEESMCLGAMVTKLIVRPPLQHELNEIIDGRAVWNTNGDTRATRIINKLLKCTGISLYCTREECLGGVSDVRLNSTFIKQQYWQRDKGKIVGPIELTVRFSGAYQRTNLVFGPLTLSVTLVGSDFSVSDEQISFISTVVVALDTHIHK